MEHGFYNLEEASRKLECETNDLLKLGAEGKIELCVWYRGIDFWDPALCPLSQTEELLLPISKEDIFQAYHGDDGFPARSQVINLATLKYKNFPMHVPGPFTLNTRTLFLSHETLQIIKAKFLRGTTGLEGSALVDSNCDKPLNLSERKSLIKMVYAMAVDCYGYDPNESKSPIPAEISEIAARADVSITDDTIRKWLKEGAKLRNSQI